MKPSENPKPEIITIEIDELSRSDQPRRVSLFESRYASVIIALNYWCFVRDLCLNINSFDRF